jgi:hypothetical protein
MNNKELIFIRTRTMQADTEKTMETLQEERAELETETKGICIMDCHI